MRRAFIVFSMLVFLVYAWASVAYQNRVAVPGYVRVEIDLLDGRTRAEWDGDQQARFQRLMDLENRRYQLPEGVGTDAERPLTAADFERRIAEQAGAGAPVTMELRDPSAITELVGRKYVLRDTIYNPVDPQAEPLYFGGRPVDKAMLDALRSAGVPYITVSGHAPAVNFQLGTAIMVALVFLTLVAALKPAVWDPFTVMMEKRARQLEQGAEAQRLNQIEADRLEGERKSRNAEAAREIQALRLAMQRETARDAAAVVKAARDKEKEAKLAGLREIALAAKEAGEAVEREIPALAEAIADAVSPGGGARRNGTER